MARLGRSQPFKPIIGPGRGRVQTFLFVRNSSDSVMNGASRLATLSRTAGVFVRGLSDSMMNGSSRTVTVTKGLVKSLSDSIMIGAGRFDSVARVFVGTRALADTVMVAASRLATVARTRLLIRNLSDSVMNAASRFVTMTRQLFTKYSFRPNVSVNSPTVVVSVDLNPPSVKVDY